MAAAAAAVKASGQLVNRLVDGKKMSSHLVLKWLSSFSQTGCSFFNVWICFVISDSKQSVFLDKEAT